MADTPRSSADLLTAFADNTTAAITPQNERDLIVSVLGGFGGLAFSAAAAGAFTCMVAAALLTGWDTNLPAIGTTPAFGTSNITVAVAAKYEVRFSLTLVGIASKIFTFALRKNGNAVSGVYGVVKQTTGLDFVTASFDGIVDCAANDVLTVYASCDADTQNITVKGGQLTVKRVS